MEVMSNSKNALITGITGQDGKHEEEMTPNGVGLNQADEEIRTLDPLLGKEMLYH